MTLEIRDKFAVGAGTGRAKCAITGVVVPKGEPCAWFALSEFTRHALSREGLEELARRIVAARLAQLAEPVVQAGRCPECGNPWCEAENEADNALLVQTDAPNIRLSTRIEDDGAIPGLDEAVDQSLAAVFCGACGKSARDLLKA